MTTDELSQDTVVTTLRDSRFVMLTTALPSGKLLSHPMTPQQVTDDADVWFFLSAAGDQADALRAGPEVNIAISEAGSWLSVAGHLEYVDDRAKRDELWDGQLESYFPGGKDDPDLRLVRVISDSAQYWGMPGGKVSALARITKAKVTGERAPGASGTVEL
ncbi:pyridoxamine 5'-phosphate oxidase family protein [Brachybacterium sp. AOP43-C2-M15]|uniref:pyridoxamine 5'-phosphate oxidase family protein n=1 Tax=Brachybacterium sp. AOP43-C2-M15 TaxID=3457661 RepID=UPI004033887C